MDKVHLLPLSHTAAQAAVRHECKAVALGSDKSYCRPLSHRESSLVIGKLTGDVPLCREIPSEIGERKRVVKSLLREILRAQHCVDPNTLLLCRVEECVTQGLESVPDQDLVTQPSKGNGDQVTQPSEADGDQATQPADFKTYIIFGVVDCLPRPHTPLTSATSLFLEGTPLASDLSSVSLVLDCLPHTPTHPDTNTHPRRLFSRDETWKDWITTLKCVLTLTPRHTPAPPSQPETSDWTGRKVCDSGDTHDALIERLNRYGWVIYKGQYFPFNNHRYLVSELRDTHDNEILQPSLSLGITHISIQLAMDEIFSKVLIAPLIDTVPSVYRIDLFNDCLRPYLLRHSLRTFAEGDLIEIDGIQFKILKTHPPSRRYPSAFSETEGMGLNLTVTATALLTDPLWFNEDSSGIRTLTSRRRLGVETQIFLGRPVLPHWLDILSPQQQNAVLSLPPQLQTFALLRQLSESPPQEIERVMRTFDMLRPTAVYGTEPDRERRVMRICQRYVVEGLPDGFYCSVCLTGEGNDPRPDTPGIVQLPCGHQYHYRCVINWFRRSLSCPLCKRNLESDMLAP
eukprot:Blabericola_migrator_1__5906@NODE_298_length_10203_cov_353_110695_g245_i0_p2_GENE_NODE_298_length_10203_cov_353_110695_g245_i0NODE_298_length_10203_cov_353_110695_g245_i0_p2_ORF_typecomplete_len571_score113_10zfRING_2/PF13639_6/1_1e10zfrbx1/PF12678_7/9_6e08zfC3HC4_3/PF13920_6/8_5e07zfC3HC4/PF00097_25/6_9e03zfC3HC4/PF00097_25/7_1e07zfC3HC4_2/PF13923_6/3e06zfRING_5/PF14634_6/4_4e05zfRING_11/PF17123_5/0_00063zfANAPC11/PF12861_7/0_0014ProkRING_4/PF14447_6/0_00088zfC3H2C3/PF17122_5/0_003zfRING_UBOX/P